jgi:hypothetical protein
MKMTGRELYDRTVTLAGIINRPRNLPQTAKYRIARLHAALEPEYKLLEVERVKLVEELGEQMYADEAKTQPTGWTIPETTPPSAQMVEYKMRWNTILNEELDVNVQPLTLTMLGNETGGIEADEFIRLGELVTE